jgi:hypothetical protein
MSRFAVIALTLALGLAFAASPFASPAPDGLERVAGDHGVRAQPVEHAAPAPGYAFPGVGDDRLATGLAGLAGTAGVFAAAAGVALLLRTRRGRVA